ncbi:MAG TPA: kelch repeat-containing protein [Candidatus Acidoferrales bacterium]|nr:kelch repeat-containing protein [Candidatus Acidoferrales bacterium]
MNLGISHRAAFVAAAFALTACSSNATSPLAPSAGMASARAPHRGKLVVRIHVPKKHRHKRRGAQYISPATQSMTLAIAGPTPVNRTVGLTPTSTGCSSSLTGTFCTLTIPGLLPGSYTATISTYDGAAGAGNELSAAQAIGFSIVAGVDNSIGITLSGIPVATLVAPANANSLANGFGIFDLEGQGAHAFVAHSVDADGNIIAGAGAPTFTIGTPSGSLAGVTASPSSTVVSAPNTFRVTPPATYAAGTAQFTVTPTFTGQSTDGCAQTGANCSGATVIVAMALPFSWAQQSPVTSPSGRWGHVMAFDASANEMVLFGGLASGTFFNDTWTWNGTNWTQLSPAQSPSARTRASMAYDAGSGDLVLFGGTDSSGTYFNDTWTWDGTDWTQRSPATSPPARTHASMTYDALHGQIVLFGGFNPIVGTLADTWTWNGVTWTQQSPATSPSARSAASTTYDAGSGAVVLFGGFNNNVYRSDTWTWNGTNWAQQSPANSPPGRGEASLAYDPTFGAAILFSGTNANGNLNDVWMWNRTTWTQLSPATSPVAREAPAMDYDGQSNALVLFGGLSNSGFPTDTWNGL